MNGTVITRREMLKTAAAGTAGISLASAVGTAAGDRSGEIRVGLIGIGNRARAHLKILSGLTDRCRITAVCDIVPERAEAGAKLAGRPDARTFTRHQELLQAGLCDAVVVATPNYTHARIVLDALAAGLHVLCEKPMATTAEDARRVRDAVRESGRVFAVGLQFRYTPIYLKLKKLIESAAVGAVKYVWAEEFRGDWARLYEDPAENAKKNWRYYQELSGGTLLEKNCHDFDILGWLVGARPVRVAALGGNSVYKDRETIDHASVTVDYENEAQLVLGVCMFAKAGRDDTVIVGSEGNLEFPRGGRRITVRRGRKQEVIELPDAPADSYGHRGTRALHEDFLAAIAGKRQPVADVNVGYEALQIPLAAEQAIRRREVINVR